MIFRWESKNIVFDGGSKDGETTAAISFNDGRVVYFDPTNDNADENGFVNVQTYDGNFTLYTSATSDKKGDFLTERDISTITNSIATFSETLAQGGSLLQQGLDLGSN